MAGLTRSGLTTFGVGLLFGFSVTFMLTYTGKTNKLFFQPKEGVHISSGFIPDSPHSHGEMDFVKGPEESVGWADEHSHSHAEESNAEAMELAQKVKIVCWVMTNPRNIESKAKHVKATWGKRCKPLVFMSSATSASLEGVVALPVGEGRENLWAKTKEAFKYLYEHHLNDGDWFFKADDDTYAVMENMRYFLKDKDPKNPLYFGRRFRPYTKNGYMSGGAGYVLSREAVKRFVEKAIPNQSLCRSDAGGAEDLEMGKCLEHVGVEAQDSRDELGRERFHPFVPEHHLIPGILPKDMWYFSYNYYPVKQGSDCCSDYSITFHYVPPNMMYVLDFLVYHLRPYGIRHLQSCPNPAAASGGHNLTNGSSVQKDQAASAAAKQ